MKTSVKVIIPVYKTNLSDIENTALKNNLTVLSGFTNVLVCPESLDVSYFTDLYKSLQVERFAGYYFDGIAGYNQLMLSSEFYSRFLDVEYILICQTDAFVFYDKLLFWCNKGYDYIGAPWVGSRDNTFKKICRKIKALFGVKEKEDIRMFKVGNGGFSLRKVRLFHNICEVHKDLINSFKTEGSGIKHPNEDVFWSFNAPELDNNFKIPDYTEALSFSIDRRPALAFKLNNKEVPFGCHGINRPNTIKIWRTAIDLYTKKNATM
ncbi:hypothetical protein D0T53_00050 [Dysgonomonas sp. 216]|uniref:DUF5672 family protein n=1 Tax=Dysgonomonas sp. 216 TaxID=2302934 RepID=UPI0013D58024|nr:DUF5672 family protein [Dysgonomonas sp. 216]NDW17304.1 hypothetical protein [Dysgonomonas sp. 216]